MFVKVSKDDIERTKNRINMKLWQVCFSFNFAPDCQLLSLLMKYCKHFIVFTEGRHHCLLYSETFWLLNIVFTIIAMGADLKTDCRIELGDPKYPYRHASFT